jgi:hypothetical protein
LNNSWGSKEIRKFFEKDLNQKIKQRQEKLKHDKKKEKEM